MTFMDTTNHGHSNIRGRLLYTDFIVLRGTLVYTEAKAAIRNLVLTEKEQSQAVYGVRMGCFTEHCRDLQNYRLTL